jgi:hypothetical protein
MKEDPSELDIEEKIEDEAVYQTFDIATYPSDFTLKGIVNMWNEGGITIPERLSNILCLREKSKCKSS